MDISYQGFDNQIITFKTDEEIEPGTPVIFEGRGKVTAATSGDDFIGVVSTCKNGLAGVIVRGAVELDCEDSSIVPGYMYICSDGDKAVGTGSNVVKLVIDVDTVNKKIVVIL